MEDIRPYADDNERDDASENPVEWDAARFDGEDEVPFSVPRD